MTVSLRVISAGKGYGYLLRSVVTGDGAATQATVFTRYFTEAGTPPGVWMGTGVEHFGDGEVAPGMIVAPAQLQTLLGRGNDPVTGSNLGRPFREYPSVTERIDDRIARIDRALPAAEFDAELARIQVEETARGSQTATAGFDLTFTVPKSVAVLWGVADAHTQELIVEAHHAAVAQVLDFFEREIAATRIGHAGVAQVEVLGVAATAYDHWDSRANDPNLHTHLVISNKAKAAHDGVWRTLDSRAIHQAVVALSEYYETVLADRLTGTFGVRWERRSRGVDRNDKWEIAGVPEELIAEFSSRSRAIEIEKNRLVAEYTNAHRRPPSAKRVVQLRAQATLDTRPEKTIHALADLTADWRQRAEQVLHTDPTAWARGLTTGPGAPALTVDAVSLDVVTDVAARVVEHVSVKRSTWRHWNLWAEACRLTMGWRFATIEDREQVVALVADAAARQSVTLTPAEVASTPAMLRRADGASAFRPRHSTHYSSEHLLAMEDRLLARSTDRTAPVVALDVIKAVTARRHDGHHLTTQQATALETVVTSGRQTDLLVGPAGAGKTTAMRALLDAWTTQHGPGTVTGLAPSAAAAQVLADDLGIACDNTAKWLHDHAHGGADFTAGQLVIIDEATLAGTRTLDAITARAEQVGAKVLLVGDPAQLQSVDAGGAFALLVKERGDVAELSEVHRFAHAWEKAASLALRAGDPAAIDVYAAHDRLREGTTDAMIDAAYAAWQRDLRAGLTSLLVTEAAESVRELNERARADRIQRGETSSGTDVVLREEARASAGDLVITRRNDRRLRTGRHGWVRNGDRWTVTAARPDGGLEVRRPGHNGGTVVLPADYVTEHVDLGYAVTAHRAQGMTLDTAHVVVSPRTTRENLYVSMTRGRQANTVYVALDGPDDLHAAPPPGDVTARSVLFGVIQHTGLELSAHQTIATEQEKLTGIGHLLAEYETISVAGQRDRWTRLVTTALTGAGRLSSAQAAEAIESDAFAVLTAELRRAEANHHDVDTLLPHIVAQRTLLDADNIMAVLTARVAWAARDPVGGAAPDLVAGLLPAARGPLTDDVRQALAERRQLIETRARTLAGTAARERAAWVRRIGEPPPGANDQERWLRELTVLAAYRDRYGITGTPPLGPSTATLVQERDAARAAAALRRAQALSTVARRTSGARIHNAHVAHT